MKVEHLEYRWHQLMLRHQAPARYIAPLWREIRNAYTNTHRHYHNLHHLADLLTQADRLRTEINDFDTLELAIWYHDIICQCLRKDNEEKSAVFAKYRMEAIQYPREKLVRCYQQINATKLHQLSVQDDEDTAWLLDFDLAVLGSHWEAYTKYVDKIRKEYSIFPTFLYNRGRKKQLQLLLERDQLFHTPLYYDRFEGTARQNIRRELVLLSK